MIFLSENESAEFASGLGHPVLEIATEFFESAVSHKSVRKRQKVDRKFSGNVQ